MNTERINGDLVNCGETYWTQVSNKLSGIKDTVILKMQRKPELYFFLFVSLVTIVAG